MPKPPAGDFIDPSEALSRGLPIGGPYEAATETIGCNMIDETAREGAQAFIDKRQPHWE